MHVLYINISYKGHNSLCPLYNIIKFNEGLSPFDVYIYIRKIKNYISFWNYLIRYMTFELVDFSINELKEIK